MATTDNLHLTKQAGTDRPDVDLQNGNWDILDEEVAARAKTWNGIAPDPVTGNIRATEIQYADNLLSDSAQQSAQTFIERTSGGAASINDGDAWLVRISGRRTHTGIVEEVLEWVISCPRPEPEEGEEPDPGIDITMDKDVFRAYVLDSSSIVLFYSVDWNTDPALYGITVTGTPAAGDTITITYVKADRGTIIQSQPTRFISTDWNLYNSELGYSRVLKYSDVFGYMITGPHPTVEFSETLTGARASIVPVSGAFTIPSDGYLWVSGGDSESTAVWMTHSDWTEGYAGELRPYSETVINLQGIMEDWFPHGLMQVGTTCDTIDLNSMIAISRIERLDYSSAAIAALDGSGREYEADTNYIYAVRETPVTHDISLDGGYYASDHGMERVEGTGVAVFVETLYGNNLKNKLERDVLTISQQTLSGSQAEQVRTNAESVKAVVVDLGTIGTADMGTQKTAEGVTAKMVCIKADLGTPSAQTGDWTVTTGADSVTVSGTISGTTTCKLYLVETYETTATAGS